jgi:hypothetical protein
MVPACHGLARPGLHYNYFALLVLEASLPEPLVQLWGTNLFVNGYFGDALSRWGERYVFGEMRYYRLCLCRKVMNPEFPAFPDELNLKIIK